jgi:Flp pilus assembly protein TadG
MEGGVVNAIRCARRRGASLVEFAVMIPVVLLFIMGIFELGQLLMTQQVVTNAAREGARRAAIASTTDSSQVDDRVREYLVRGGLPSTVVENAAKTVVSIEPEGNLKDLEPGTPVSVSVTVRFGDVSLIAGTVSTTFDSAKLKATASAERE